jgi:uncharacterized protein (DUF427 family)
MARATWNGAVLAESDETILVDGNHYFPRNSITDEFFAASQAQTRCARKGIANYFDVVVDGRTNAGAAWYYADPKPAASDIKGYVAFWRGVKVDS